MVQAMNSRGRPQRSAAVAAEAISGAHNQHCPPRLSTAGLLIVWSDPFCLWLSAWLARHLLLKLALCGCAQRRRTRGRTSRTW